VPADLVELKELAGLGALRPVIDRTYRLEEMVEAHRYVDVIALGLVVSSCGSLACDRRNREQAVPDRSHGRTR
jgi:hypothetical protein